MLEVIDGGADSNRDGVSVAGSPIDEIVREAPISSMRTGTGWW